MTPAPTSALTGRRVALVVGNGGYEVASRLASPLRDAFAMGSLLERIGFEVQVATDCDYADFRARLRDFADRLDGASLALFFFSGHGVAEAGAANHLLPVDADIREAEDLGRVTVPLQRVLDHMQAPGRVCLVLLDACHDDPFAHRASGGATKGVLAGQPGLAAVAREALDGTLIGFAADEGRVALDGGSGLSPFTRALTETLEQPGQEIRDAMIEVRRRVIEATERRQQPWVKDKLSTPLVLVPGPEAVAAAGTGGAPAGGGGLLPGLVSRAGTPPVLVHAAANRRVSPVPALSVAALVLGGAWVALDDPRGLGCGQVALPYCAQNQTPDEWLSALAAGDTRAGELLLAFLSDAGVPEADRGVALRRLVQGSPDEARLGAVLTQVPADVWQAPEMVWPLEAAHAAIRTGALGAATEGLRETTGYFDRASVTIYTQFVGYDAATALALVTGLNTRFGWSAHDPSPVTLEDVGVWSDVGEAHQIRYNPHDPLATDAARLLVSELSCAEALPEDACAPASGVSGTPLPVFEPRPEPEVRPGEVEIWLALD